MIRAAITTLGDAAQALTARFAAAGVDQPRLDARLLVAAAAGVVAQDILLRPDQPFPASALERLEEFARRRVEREPVSRILGHRGFWTLDLAVDPSTLDPRPDTETVIRVVLDRLGEASPNRILDLGTGTGAILLALLSEYRQALGVGTDVEAQAVELATRNAHRCGLAGRARFVQGSWVAGVEGPFAVVVSNPPYIPAADIGTLDPEVRRYDPLSALVGDGEDGLGCYRALIPQAGAVLRQGGLIALEVGIGQGPDVANLLHENGFIDIVQTPDYGGHVRCVSGLWIG